MKTRFDKAYIEITNCCNLSCSFCGLTVRPRIFMDESDFILVLDRLSGWTKILYFHLMGEPFLHPAIFRFLELAGERGFSVNLTTNGTLLSERLPGAAAVPSLARLNLSVQSLEQFPPEERIERLRSLVSCVRAFASRQRLVRPDFLSSFRFWTRDNGGFSSPLLEELARAFNPDSSRAGVLTPEILAGRNGFVLSPGMAVHAADTFEWPSLPQPGGEAGGGTTGSENRDTLVRGFCRGLRDQIGVLADGTVVPCCLDRNGDIALGNLLREDLQTILERPRARALYDGFTARRVVEPLCNGCSYRKRFDSKPK